MRAKLKTVPAAILLTFGALHLSANAGLTAKVCEVNGVNACESPNTTIEARSVLTIRGYAFDLVNGDRPVNATGGYVMVRNEDTLVDYRLQIQAIEARPDILASHIEGTLNAQNYETVNAGFAAQVFMSSLPVGRYSVQEVRLNMKSSGLIKLSFDDASHRATFNIDAGASPFRLVKGDGAVVPLTMGKFSNNSIPASGYPALRDGSFTIEAKLPVIGGGETQKSVSFNYKRPVMRVPVSLPLVENFPGVAQRFTLTNPLTNRMMDGAKINAVVDQAEGDTVSVDGAAITVGKTLEIAQYGTSVGVYQTAVNDSVPTEGQQTVTLWVDQPDAPNIQLVTNRWDPSKKVAVEVSAQSVPVKVEDMDVMAKLQNPSADTCQLLRTIKTANFMGQVAGIDCAIKFTDFPEGMKYSPYYANALRGAVSNIGENKLTYSVGVFYTDPATKKTEFYPSKTGLSEVSVNGIEPKAIELNFRNDKGITSFYEKNEALFPGKYFALVDPLQERALGVMGVKSAHRGVRTRIVYPGAEPKEVFSSILDSSVPMMLMADTPWESKKVVVESWYEKAPEYKTTLEMDFIAIPMGPVVELEKEFTSHDKAETILRGNIGISKGQSLSFDPASMGAWQVAIVNEKTGETIGQPVAVDGDGGFVVNLGMLSAGTRYIIAQARMLTTGGDAANSLATSKKRSLVTSIGDAVEASLAVRSTSGKAPFVQTIVTNFKNPKMQSSIKSVSWERMGAGGSWEPVMRNGSGDTPHIGISYIATVEATGEKQYRAVLINKYSGAVYSTEPITLVAFDVPSFKVTGPVVVQTKKPVTFTIAAEEGFDAEYMWKLITSGGVEDVGPVDGASFTFTPTEVKSYAVEVVGRQVGSPADNPTASVKKSAAVRAVNPLTARASITGPRQLETGKPYEFKATINDVVSSNLGKDYVLKGYWLLPDGSRVDGTDLTFTARQEDKLLSFYTYVDGYPDETSVSTYSFSTWGYVWPTQWQISLQPVTTDVPASVKFSIETPAARLSSLNGEPLTFTWSLPEGITQSAGGDMAGTLAISKTGNYQIAVQVADTRGNTVNIRSEEFSIWPPASVETEINMVSKYGENFFAPGSYYISTKTLKLPRGDSFLRHEALINGQKVGEYTGSGHYVAFNEPGEYEVTVRTLTKSGNYGEKVLNVNVQTPPQPNCEVKLSSTTSGILASPVCSVYVGYIKAYTWTYVHDGQEKKSTSKSFLIAKQWLTNNSVGAVSLEVETDMGAKSTFNIDYR